jgi:hypothetical protein
LKKTDKDESIPDSQEKFRAEPFQAWWFSNDIRDGLFDMESTKPKKEMKIETFDIPYLHLKSEEGYNFMCAIGKMKREPDDTASDICFNKESISMLVQYHWREARWGWDGFYPMTFIPFFITAIVYLYWSQYVLY